MFEFNIEEIDEMFLLQAEGENSEVAKEKLDKFLSEKEISPKKYYYLEMWSEGEISGAMTMALVDKEVEGGDEVRTYTTPKSPYLTFELYYDDYINPEISNQIDWDPFLEEKGYRMVDFPIFEYLPTEGKKKIKIIMRVE